MPVKIRQLRKGSKFKVEGDEHFFQVSSINPYGVTAIRQCATYVQYHFTPEYKVDPFQGPRSLPVCI